MEITSYGVLALLANQQYSEALPYFKWLLNQRNDKGGFEGTQDTVVGLQALAKFAERISTKENSIQLVVKSPETNETHITINSENALVLQSFEVSIRLSFLFVQNNTINLLLAATNCAFNRCNSKRSWFRVAAIIVSLSFK